MASINVRPEFYVAPESSNKEAVSSIIQQVHPITSNLSSGTLSGDVIFEINTGANQYLDLFKSHLVVNHTVTITTSTASFDNVAMCLFDRAQMFINGVKVANSNNFTQDSILSKRLNFSAAYNRAVNDILYLGAIASTADYPGATTTKHSSMEFLDALFIRTPDVIIPPNSNVRIILSAASGSTNGINKMYRADGDNTAGVTLAINDLYFNTYYLNKSDQVGAQHILKFVTPESFVASIGGTSLTQQFSCRKNLVRLCAAFQSTIATSALANYIKIYNTTLFRYATDDSTTRPNTILFKAGSQNLPNRAFDNTTYNFRESHMAMQLNSEGILDPAGKETFTEWGAQGQIYTVPVVKSISDDVSQVELQVTFASAPAAVAFFTIMYEQFVSFSYGPNGQLLETIAAI